LSEVPEQPEFCEPNDERICRLLSAMMCKRCIYLVLVSASVTAWSEVEPLFSVKQASGDSNGITFQTSGGTMRIGQPKALREVAHPMPWLGEYS